MKKKILSLFLVVLMICALVFATSCDLGGGGGDEPEVYIVTFDVNGGDELDEEEIEVEEGELIEEYETPKRDGYTFLGWYYDDELWNFDEDVVEEDIELVAKWEENSLICDDADHEWAATDSKDATCLNAGYINYVCSVCDFKKREPLPKLGHNIVQEHQDANCGVKGYDREYCLNAGCDLDFTTNEVLPTGFHEYNEDGYIRMREPTNYIDGVEQTRCNVCGSTKDRAIAALKSAQFSSIDIGSYKYTGGTYTNTPFVNLATYGVATFSSHYAICVGANAIDGAATSYWSADTLVDGASMTGDWLAVELEDTTDIGAVKLIVPNYYLWNLGENCYISYDIEAYIDNTDDGTDNPEWVKVGELTDKGNTETSLSVRLLLELDTPINTNKVRAVVTNSLRYAPAMIYEMEVYGYVSEVERTVQSVSAEASYSITGKYNSYAGGADKLYDGNLSSGWMTNAREWMGDSGITRFENTFEDNTKIKSIKINATKLVGETINIKYRVETVNDEGKVVTSWQLLKTLVIDESAADEVEFVESCDITTKALRFEVDNYGDWDADENPAKNTITGITVTTDSGEVELSPSWSLPSTSKATISFPTSRYVACVQWVTGYTEGREFILEIKGESGKWETVGTFLIEKTNKSIVQETIAGKNCAVITYDVEDFVTDIRLTLSKEKIAYDSYVYEFTPYAIVENGVGINEYEGCMHALASRSDNVVVAPTCDAAGYQDTVCITPNCGFRYRTDATDATGHTWGDWIEAPLASGNLTQQVCYCEVDNCEEMKIRSYRQGYEPATITDWLNDGTAAWSMSLDDGNYLATYEWALEFFPKYGFKGTAVLTIGMMDIYVENWKQYVASGVFDIGSHSYTHASIYNSTMNEKNGLYEVNDAYFWLMGTFPGQRVMGFATPNGATSNSSARWVTGVHGGGRNGGGTGSFYQTYETLSNRQAWGNLNTYVSKSAETEGVYEYVAKGSVETNWVYSAATNKLENQNGIDGTYYYIPEEYKYEWRETGSYDKNGDTYVFRNDNEGAYILAHTEKGSYEKGIDTLVAGNGWTVECLHEFESGPIYSSYVSTISKFEYLKKTGVWAGSYTDVIQYIKENKASTVTTTEYTDTQIKLSLTDTLENEFFNHALTIKVDIPDEWTSITATQAGEEIDCFIKTVDGNAFAYVNAVPDCGEIVVAKN